MPELILNKLLNALPLLLVMTFAAAAPCQTLARPGWAGSGMTAAPWWKRPVVYHADPRGFGGLHGLAEHMDYVHSLGVDAMLLTSLSTDPKQSIDPALGTMDDLEEIIRRASQFNIRVLTEIDPHGDLNSATRLWLVHGVAGFYSPGATAAQLAEIRRFTTGFAGERIVIGDLSAIDLQVATRSADAPQLVADNRLSAQDKLSAAAFRSALEASQQIADRGPSTPLLFSDAPSLKRSFTRYGNGTHDDAIAKVVAATLLTTRSSAMLYCGQELGLANGTSQILFGEPKKGEQPPPGSEALGNASGSSLLNWYRQLIALAHSNRTISSGAITILDHDDQNVLAWIRRPASVSTATPPVIVIENLSAQPVTVSLKADIQRLHLRGSFLRTVLRSDNAMGAMHLDGMTLQPYQVFIGELRY
jgi:glycosidase